MNLYVGSVEKWNQFFSGLHYLLDNETTDFNTLLKSIEKYNLKEVNDYFHLILSIRLNHMR